MRYLGKDPASFPEQSPAVWDDGDCYVVQGWCVTDARRLAAIGSVPEGETVIRIPKRLMTLFPEVTSERTD